MISIRDNQALAALVAEMEDHGYGIVEVSNGRGIPLIHTVGFSNRKQPELVAYGSATRRFLTVVADYCLTRDDFGEHLDEIQAPNSRRGMHLVQVQPFSTEDGYPELGLLKLVYGDYRALLVDVRSCFCEDCTRLDHR